MLLFAFSTLPNGRPGEGDSSQLSIFPTTILRDSLYYKLEKACFLKKNLTPLRVLDRAQFRLRVEDRYVRILSSSSPFPSVSFCSLFFST